MRVIIPPVGNEVISMVKLTSVASVIQFSEILRNAQTIYYANARVIELLIVAAGWYLIVVTVLSIGQYFLERHFAKGAGAAPGRGSGRRPRGSAPYDGAPPWSSRADVHKYFGSLQALNGVSLEVAPGRGAVHHRPVGLGQEHLSALHQPAREGRPGRHLDRRRAGRFPPRRRRAATS